MVVQHNITSMNANRQLGIVGGNLAKASEKLSSGYRINRAADDAAGLAISEKMRSQVRGLQRASDNAQDGISLIQTAEGAMDAQHQILQRARELVVQRSNSAVLSDTDQAKINDELTQLNEEISRIADSITYNGTALHQREGKLQVGADDSSTDAGAKKNAITLDKNDLTFAKSLASTGTADTTISDMKTLTIDQVDKQIEVVSSKRSKLGAIQNRLEYTVKVVDNTAENMASAESRIRDTDMADEMTRFSKENILQQAATSMLAQANQANQGVLSLLQ